MGKIGLEMFCRVISKQKTIVVIGYLNKRKQKKTTHQKKQNNGHMVIFEVRKSPHNGSTKENSILSVVSYVFNAF